MPEPYFCPHCRGNRTRFALIQRISQEVEKDPRTGAIREAAEEWVLESRGDQPYVEVRCLSCGFEGYEGLFIQAAARDREKTKK